jgi:transcription elongation factor Elf1
VKLNLPAGTFPDLIVSNFAVNTARSIELTCPHCDGSMSLVRRIDLKEMPEIYIFYCSRCQHAETVKEEQASRELVDAE